MLRFNSGKNFYGQTIDILNSTQSGFQAGLKLDLYFKVPESKDVDRVVISIHNVSNKPMSLYNRETYISSGYKTYFEIERVFNHKLEEPYNNCINDIAQFKLNRTIINIIKNSNIIYSQKECFRLCRNMYMITNNQCGCDSPIDVIKRDCVLRLMNEYANTISYLIFDKYCPLECDSLNYQIVSN